MHCIFVWFLFLSFFFNCTIDATAKIFDTHTTVVKSKHFQTVNSLPELDNLRWRFCQKASSCAEIAWTVGRMSWKHWSLYNKKAQNPFSVQETRLDPRRNELRRPCLTEQWSTTVYLCTILRDTVTVSRTGTNHLLLFKCVCIIEW